MKKILLLGLLCCSLSAQQTEQDREIEEMELIALTVFAPTCALLAAIWCWKNL